MWGAEADLLTPPTRRPRFRPQDRRNRRRSAALAFGWSLAATLYAAFAVWLVAHPASLPSDDALYFSRGLVRFSVIDFSPQFPGYPGFILLGRIVRLALPDPLEALFALTVTIALALPPMAALAAWRSSRNPGIALAVFVVTLTQPLLPDLALALLSDGAGILAFIAFLAPLPAEPSDRRAAPWLAGLALGIAAACRPSDAALFLGGLAGAAIAKPRALLPIIGGALIAGIPALLFVLAHEGTLYWLEALRFVTGHTLQWGNTAFSQAGPNTSWWDAIAAVPGGSFTAALALLIAGASAFRLKSAPAAVSAGLLGLGAQAFWVLVMQNPDHLRHLAPLTLLAGLLAGIGLRPGRLRTAALSAMLLLNVFQLAATVDPATNRSPPLARAIERLDRAPPGSAVAVNDGVALLRQSLPAMRVYDQSYPADAAFGLSTATGAALRLATTPLDGRPAIARFPGRFLGEEGMLLYDLGRRPDDARR